MGGGLGPACWLVRTLGVIVAEGLLQLLHLRGVQRGLNVSVRFGFAAGAAAVVRDSGLPAFPARAPFAAVKSTQLFLTSTWMRRIGWISHSVPRWFLWIMSQ